MRAVRGGSRAGIGRNRGPPATPPGSLAIGRPSVSRAGVRHASHASAGAPPKAFHPHESPTWARVPPSGETSDSNSPPRPRLIDPDSVAVPGTRGGTPWSATSASTRSSRR